MCACKVEWKQEEEEEEVDGRRHRDGFGLCPGSTQPGKGNRPNPSFVCPSIRPRQTPPPSEPVRAQTVALSCSVAWGWSRKWTRSIHVPCHGFVSFISRLSLSLRDYETLGDFYLTCTLLLVSTDRSPAVRGKWILISVEVFWQFRWFRRKEFNVSTVCQNGREGRGGKLRLK